MPIKRMRDPNERYRPPAEPKRVDILPGLSKSAFNLTLFVDPGTPSAKTIAYANRTVAVMIQQKLESRTLSDPDEVERLQNLFTKLADINYRLSSHTREESAAKTTEPPKTGIARALSALALNKPQSTPTPEGSSFGQLGPNATQIIAEGEAATVLNGLGIAANILDDKTHTDPLAAQNAAAMRTLRSQIYGSTEPPAIYPVY